VEHPYDKDDASSINSRRRYLLAELRCATLRARLWQADIDSLALQFGCPLEILRHALLRDSQGRPSTPLVAAIDAIGGWQ
jgi:hypothetical protein